MGSPSRSGKVRIAVGAASYFSVRGAKRAEQANSLVQADLEAALDHIEQDLQNATFIYPNVDSIKAAFELERHVDLRPVLAFWKPRESSDGFAVTQGDRVLVVYFLDRASRTSPMHGDLQA